jgi:uncharacterized protein (TIGR04255 family)
MTDQICYKKNFIAAVIARIDFVSPISSLEKTIPQNIIRCIRNIFPIQEPNVKNILNVDDISGNQKNVINTEWTFHGKNREKSFTLTPNSFFTQYNTYNSYEEFSKEFLDISSNILLEFQDTADIGRLGLRYVNNILFDGDPLDWYKYINNNFLTLINFKNSENNLTRIFQTMEYDFDDYNLKFRFGLPNPDFPSKIKQKIYVLDYDAYYMGAIDNSTLGTTLEKYHSCIQEFFEASITDELRKEMNE